MGEYISRAHLMAELTSSDMQTAVRGMTGAEAYSAFLRMVNDAPAADVAEVVRCKDCIYRDGKSPGQPNIICFQMKDDDFCSYGARMDKEDEHEIG